MDFTEIQTLIEDQGRAFEAFKADHNAALDEQAQRIAALQTAGAHRPGAIDKPNLAQSADFKAMRDFMRGARAEMTGSNGPDGGYTVPKEVDSTIHDQLVSISPMRSIARVVQTSTRDYHTLIGTRGTTTGWVGEEGERTETDTPNLADIVPPSGEVFAYPFATNWLLDDAAFELDAWLRDNVTTEIALQEGQAFISGDGVNKPRGLLTYTAASPHPLGTIGEVETGAAADITPDGLIDVVYNLAAPYRQGAAFLMNSATAGKVRKMKLADGTYIWQPSLIVGQPATILGYPVVIDESMPDVAADATPISFGNFKRGYLITDRTGISVVRDNVTKPGWTKFYFAKRVGGCIADIKALRLLRVKQSG